ncbi:Ankyrin repeat domain-containing protein 55 [Aphanomyces cochlioides]|nr:Ankyrin repeat domain-containing protein 55 [Aphanomyces cochlioides]
MGCGSSRATLVARLSRNPPSPGRTANTSEASPTARTATLPISPRAASSTVQMVAATLPVTLPNALSPSEEVPPDDAAIRLLRNVKQGNLLQVLATIPASPELINVRGMWESTPLLYACQYGHGSIALFLLEQGADVSLVNEKNVSCLLLASLEGLTAVVAVVLTKCPTEHLDLQGTVYNSFTDTNQTLSPLMAACTNGHLECAGLLLEHEASLGSKEPVLVAAATHGHTAIATMLLTQYDVSPVTCDAKGRSALFRALSGGFDACALAILSAMSSEIAHTAVADLDGNNTTALHLAAQHNCVEVCRWLLAKQKLGILVDAVNSKGETSLLLAARKSHAAIVKELIVAGADVDKCEKSGRSIREVLRKNKLEHLAAVPAPPVVSLPSHDLQPRNKLISKEGRSIRKLSEQPPRVTPSHRTRTYSENAVAPVSPRNPSSHRGLGISREGATSPVGQRKPSYRVVAAPGSGENSPLTIGRRRGRSIRRRRSSASLELETAMDIVDGLTQPLNGTTRKKWAVGPRKCKSLPNLANLVVQRRQSRRATSEIVIKPDSIDAQTILSEAAKSSSPTSKSEAAKALSIKSEATGAQTIKPVIATARVMKPETSKATTIASEATKTSASKLGIVNRQAIIHDKSLQQENIEVQAIQPNASKDVAIEHKSVKPQATKPEILKVPSIKQEATSSEVNAAQKGTSEAVQEATFVSQTDATSERVIVNKQDKQLPADPMKDPLPPPVGPTVELVVATKALPLGKDFSNIVSARETISRSALRRSITDAAPVRRLSENFQKYHSVRRSTAQSAACFRSDENLPLQVGKRILSSRHYTINVGPSILDKIDRISQDDSTVATSTSVKDAFSPSRLKKSKSASTASRPKRGEANRRRSHNAGTQPKEVVC